MVRPFSSEGTSRIISLREIAAVLVRFTGIGLLARKTVCRRRATIIVYHDPTPESLQRHLEYLSARFALISLSKLVTALREDRWQEIPDAALVVTIDDGHKNNAQLLSICSDFDLNPTVYICSHLIGTNRHFWWNEADSLTQEVKRIPHEDALALLDQKTGYSPKREYSSRKALSEEELLALSHAVEIGSHTCFHPVLPNCSTEDCGQEVTISKSKLEDLLRRPVRHFSYPNGDHGSRERTLAAEAGYHSARTLDTGWVDAESDPYRLKAICVDDDASINVLSAQVCGVFQYVRYLKNGSLTGRRPWGLL